MAWGSSVILLLNLAETWTEFEEDGELVSEEIESEALNNVNKWLQDNHSGQLVDLSLPAHSAGDRSMLCEFYAGAFNHLEPEDFINLVRQQTWRDPENVQILVMSEFEERFTMVTLEDAPYQIESSGQTHLKL